jgi:hypothetical protein
MTVSNCKKNEHNLAILSFALFIIIILSTTLLGFQSILYAIFNSALYVTLITGIFLVIQAVRKIGVSNFVGRSLSYFGVAAFLSLINILVVNFSTHLNLSGNTLFKFNEYMWLAQAVLMTAGLFFLLTMYKLRFPKYIMAEVIPVFVITLFGISFFAGWPQILNALLITTGVMSLRISGRKTHCGVVSLSLGLIFLVISNIFFIYRTWNGISFFGDISDVVLLISWITIVLGIYFTKKYHA